VLGKHSGRHALKDRIRELGYHLDEAQFERVFDAFKVLADRKKVVTDADIEALARGSQIKTSESVVLEGFSVQSRSDGPATGTVRLRRDGQPLEHQAQGDGPIDAVFKAIEQMLGLKLVLESFTLSAVTGGEDAQGEATVKVRQEKKVFNGHGLSTDVIEASIRAFLAAINALMNEPRE